MVPVMLSLVFHAYYGAGAAGRPRAERRIVVDPTGIRVAPAATVQRLGAAGSVVAREVANELWTLVIFGTWK
ncbi:unnamed protein product [Parascedosporium putredinis]|uniref:Uncharacterized protein n=1 Tax=Parascedosporium putredinis TaxID=1442378 RepID=A0A9P1GVD0_9PEZI|nr:unnamed protein product [Parascedosporium putredinis]CAI7988038.1 unnamed protein product [Parascedosporium putredinis]